MINVAIIGHGVVGSGVAEILINKAARVTKSAKTELNLKYIVDLREFPDLPYSDRFTKDFQDVINDDSVKIVAEMMGGVHPAFEFATECLKKGKSFVTSNKELVAKKGAELIRLARENNANFLFEASVGGGIPIIRPMTQCLAANDICEIKGILNGTSNFILTKMIKENVSLETALAEAQRKGYAEKDPSADIDGDDACRKICILATLAYGKHIYPDFVKTEGIRNIKLDDVYYAMDGGYVIKLIGRTKNRADGKIYIGVAPQFVKTDDPLSCVEGVFNAITVNGDETGDVMFYGKGAGKKPTASAVVADIIDCSKHLESRKFLDWEDGTADAVADSREESAAFYIKAESNDPAALKNEISEKFGTVRVLHRENAPSNEVAFITEEMKIGGIEEVLKNLTNGVVKSKIRILD